MDGKKNNFMGDIYTSYGPLVGKVCENVNTQLHQDNIIESLTSSITPNSINISNHTSPVDNIIGGKTISTLQDVGPVEVIPMIKSTHKSKGGKKIKFGGDTNVNTNITKQVITEPVVSDKTNLDDEESTGFFNYKISIYNHKISIWILLLILLVIICIGYFIYKYWYLKNTSIITYKKSNSDEINKSINEENTLSDSDDETDNSTKSNSLSSNTTKSTKSTKLTKSK